MKLKNVILWTESGMQTQLSNYIPLTLSAQLCHSYNTHAIYIQPSLLFRTNLHKVLYIFWLVFTGQRILILLTTTNLVSISYLHLSTSDHVTWVCVLLYSSVKYRSGRKSPNKNRYTLYLQQNKKSKFVW